MHDVKAAHRIRVQLERFSGKLSDGLPKVARRVVREVLYGVQARGSVRLSEIARSLREPIGLRRACRPLREKDPLSRRPKPDFGVSAPLLGLEFG